MNILSKLTIGQQSIFGLIGAVLLGVLAITLFVSAKTVENSYDHQTASEIAEVLFGYSTEGREITGAIFGDGEETILLFGGIHGNEKGSSQVLELLTDELTEQPEFVGDDVRVIVIPVTNPDGYIDRTDKLNTNGVNLNRNFKTTDWVRFEDGIDAGIEPFSEIESQIIASIIEQYDVDKMIAYHSQGGLSIPEYTQESRDLAAWYANKTGYQYFDEWDYFGTATRWFEEVHKKPAITVELTSHYLSDWAVNRPAILELIGGIE